MIICICSLHNPLLEKAALHYHCWKRDQINRYTWKNIPMFRSCRDFCTTWILSLLMLSFQSRMRRCACSHLHACSCCASSAVCACRCLNVSLLSEGGEVECVETLSPTHASDWICHLYVQVVMHSTPPSWKPLPSTSWSIDILNSFSLFKRERLDKVPEGNEKGLKGKFNSAFLLSCGFFFPLVFC